MVVAQCLQTERCSDISSSLCFSCAMMGLQATSGKRKLEGAVGCMDFDMELGESPSKLGRVEGSWWAIEESYASTPTALSQTNSTAYYDMEVVASSCLQSATSNNPCQLSQVHNSTTTTQGTTSLTSPTTNLTGSISSGCNSTSHQQQSSVAAASNNNCSQSQQQQSCQHNNHHHQSIHQSINQHYYQRPVSQANNTSYQQQQLLRQQMNSWGHHTNTPHHYEPPTIRREENGKSYLELGSSYRANERCCDGSRPNWCRLGRACYMQGLGPMYHATAMKFARAKQFGESKLYQQALLCSTMLTLQRQMERDRNPPLMEPFMPPPMTQFQSPEQGRLTPFPMPAISSSETDVDSGIGDSEDSRSINWGSVLSLSSQSPLDLLNNNELLDVDIGPDLDLDFMPGGWKLTPLTSTSTTTSFTTSDNLLRGVNSNSTNESSMVQQQHHHHSHQQHLQNGHLNHHHHHHHLQQGNINSGSCNNTSGTPNSGSSTHESLMCTGS